MLVTFFDLIDELFVYFLLDCQTFQPLFFGQHRLRVNILNSN